MLLLSSCRVVVVVSVLLLAVLFTQTGPHHNFHFAVRFRPISALHISKKGTRRGWESKTKNKKKATHVDCILFSLWLCCCRPTTAAGLVVVAAVVVVAVVVMVVAAVAVAVVRPLAQQCEIRY